MEGWIWNYIDLNKRDIKIIFTFKKTNKMKKFCLYLTGIFFTLISCQKSEIKNISFDDEFIAKNLIEVQCDFPENSENQEYTWYIGQTPDGEWEKLPGIWSDEIILLTSYVGKYLKCEVSCTILNSDEKITASVISSKPVEYKGNSNTDWFKDAGYSIIVVPERSYCTRRWAERVE